MFEAPASQLADVGIKLDRLLCPQVGLPDSVPDPARLEAVRSDLKRLVRETV